MKKTSIFVVSALVVIFFIVVGYLALQKNINNNPTFGGGELSGPIPIFGDSVYFSDRGYITTSTDYYYGFSNGTTSTIKSIRIGERNDTIVLSLTALSSTSASTLRIHPQVSNDGEHWSWYDPIKPTSSTTLLNATSTIYWPLPTTSDVVTSTQSFAFEDINSEYIRFIFNRDDETVSDDNMSLYAEVTLKDKY